MTKVLIADDDYDMQSILRALLLEEGHHVISAHDGQTMLQLLGQEGNWIIFLDVRMPGMNGYQVLEQMHQDPHLQNQNTVILMSAAWRSNEGQRFLSTIVQAVLPKPFELDEILDIVRRFSAV
jgi:CheY-like chemotaxis protein